MKIKSLTIFMACLLLSCFAVPVLTACCSCPPPQPSCYRCENCVWVWNCCSSCTCCKGSCCSGECCDDKTCYDPSTKRCCGYGTGQTCDKGKICCYGSCCDPKKCEDCNSVSKKCESRCKSINCETCDGNGNCKVCGGDTTKCCEGPPGCVKKCIDDAAVCVFEIPPWKVDCASQNPRDTSCQTGVAGMLCGSRIVYVTTTAKCAACAPGCASTYVEPCATIYPVRCENVSVWPIFVCRCTDEDATPQHAGARYVCIK